MWRWVKANVCGGGDVMANNVLYMVAVMANICDGLLCIAWLTAIDNINRIF